MKIASSQTIGVAPLQELSAMSSVQTTFSVSLQVVGSPVSVVVPFRLGPRHCGQLSAARTPAAERPRRITVAPAAASERLVVCNAFPTFTSSCAYLGSKTTSVVTPLTRPPSSVGGAVRRQTPNWRR